MKIPSQERGPQSFVDEQQRTKEHSEYNELHRARESHTDPERFSVDELPQPKKQTPSQRNGHDQTRSLQLLSQYVAGIAAVTVIATTVALSPPSPQFSLTQEEIGLHGYACVLQAENVEGSTLNAYLLSADGELLRETPLLEDDSLSFDDLEPETAYTLLVQDERESELFRREFVTDPFVTLTEEGDNLMQLILHEDIPQGLGDATFFLYDAEGKCFHDNIYSVITEDGWLDGDSENGTDSSELMPTFTYYLYQSGLYTGEYVLQFITYPPELEGELIYEKTLTLGDLRSLHYVPTIDHEAATLTLTYQDGDLGIYETLSVELEGENYYFVDTADLTLDENGNITIPISTEWVPGEYTLYLLGNYQQGDVYLNNQIFKCNVIVPDLQPSIAVEQETVGLHDYQATLTTKHTEKLTLNAYLVSSDGESLRETPLSADGTVSFTDLAPETAHTLLIQDEQANELLRHEFTTDPFVALTQESDGLMRLTLHEDIPQDLGDATFFLYDAEGKSFHDHIFVTVIEEPLPDASADPTDSSQYIYSYLYSLYTEGLYIGDYVLQHVLYLPEDGELIYETHLTLGTLSPLVYNPTTDTNAGTLSLQYVSGDLGPYQELSAELYQGENYYGYVDTADLTFDENGNITFPISPDWESGTYTLYLIGNTQSDGNYIYNQIFKCEIVI